MAATVNTAFQAACGQYGVPVRTRMDHGVENQDVVNYMLQQHPDTRGAAIQGSSVHNQRIERLWLDVFNNVLSFYHDLFSGLERENLLDADNEKHIMALHYVFLPLLQQKLNAFTQQHNHHGLSTEHGQSPCQLWVGGALQEIHSGRKGIQGIYVMQLRMQNLRLVHLLNTRS